MMALPPLRSKESINLNKLHFTNGFLTNNYLMLIAVLNISDLSNLKLNSKKMTNIRFFNKAGGDLV